MCVALCCSTLCLSVGFCIVLQHAASKHVEISYTAGLTLVALCCSVLQCVLTQHQQAHRRSNTADLCVLLQCAAWYLRGVAVCYIMSASCCSVLQYVTVYHSVLQCVATHCSQAHRSVYTARLTCVAGMCSVLQCVAVCCSVLQCVAVCCSVCAYPLGCANVYLCVAVHWRVLQCVVGCCSVL